MNLFHLALATDWEAASIGSVLQTKKLSYKQQDNKQTSIVSLVPSPLAAK
jgi:hypothetical protein